ncbi:MAG TPA: glycosyltransferase family 4 protein [Solirubrobacteraceae bacterium]|nr:glycosyltransferase family 4 protein [Solirubrobacteraceae bacterium]
MRVHVVDPSAYTPPYDHALCRALAAAGAQVTLYTSRFTHADAPVPRGYARREHFYRAATRIAAGEGARARARGPLKLAEHVPDMLRYRRAARAAEIVHFQWLPVQPLDVHLLPSGRPLLLSAHDVLPREPRPGQARAQRRLYERMDAIVVHSEHGRERLTGELGIAPARVYVIPHGVLRPWEGLDGPRLPPELAGAGGGPVALFFGLLRPYKGLEDLLAAWREAAARLPPGAELWIAGMPRMDIGPLRAAATVVGDRAGGERPVRLLSRFLAEEEIHALLARASLVALPYRQIEQSGVAFTALGAGVPLLLSDVGGFPELARTGAARTFPAGDVRALAAELVGLLGDPPALAAMAARARAAAAGPYAWEGIARRTLALYERLLRENPPR